MQLVIAIRKLLKLIQELVNIITTEVYYIYAYQKRTWPYRILIRQLSSTIVLPFFTITGVFIGQG